MNKALQSEYLQQTVTLNHAPQENMFYSNKGPPVKAFCEMNFYKYTPIKSLAPDIIILHGCISASIIFTCNDPDLC